jgi:DNA-binding SARP family transcriptional activator
MALRIQLLGNFFMEFNGEPITAVDRVRLQSVLAYLLLRSQTRQSRQQVAFQLWPDSSEEQARSNLRKALHELRHLLPDADRFLHVDARSVQWQPDALYTFDVNEFETGLQRAAAIPADPATQRAILAEAVVLYRGDLLPGCYDAGTGSVVGRSAAGLYRGHRLCQPPDPP